ncbi:MAG: coiled-coil domain-containing protein [Promethearchaeota archaeon]
MEELKKRLEERENELNIKNKLIKSKSEEIAELEKVIEDYKAAQDAKTLSQYETKFRILEERIQDKDTRIANLEKSIKQSNDLISEYRDYKEKYEKLHKEFDEQSTKLKDTENLKTELERKNRDLTYKVENLEERLEREIKSLKALHQKELEEAEKLHSEKIKSLKYKLAPTQIFLKYVNNQFVRAMSQPSEGIFLILDESRQKWILDYSLEPNLIERKTAERQARSLAKSGFIIGGNRVGIRYDLEIASESKVPEKLLREQHKYNV